MEEGKDCSKNTITFSGTTSVIGVLINPGRITFTLKIKNNSIQSSFNYMQNILTYHFGDTSLINR